LGYFIPGCGAPRAGDQPRARERCGPRVVPYLDPDRRTHRAMVSAMRSWLLVAALVALLPLAASAQVVYRVDLQLEGMIDPGVAALVERVIEEATEAKAAAIVFEIDTFGGRVDAATVIRDAILDAEPLTVAFINKRAISAGALISLACDKIVMTQAATMGATTPVEMTGEKASDKITSYMRAEMRATAERTGRDVKIAEAMVDERVDLPDFSAEAGRPATLTTTQALRHKMIDGTAETLSEALRLYDLGSARVIEVRLNWAEHLVRFLTHPIITSILLAVAMFGIITEIRTPGWGLGGTLALVALALFFGSHLILKVAEWQDLLIFIAGLGLLIVEIFFIPGFGVVGLVGIGLMVASLAMTQLGDFRLWSVELVAGVLARLSASLIAAVVLSVLFIRALPRFSTFNRLILGSQISAAEGYVASPAERDAELTGRRGTALSDLRPAGIGLFDGQRLDVVADGEFIERQTPIQIVEARGSRVVVRPV
jgi:membrane-bound serine protease (ClpP class)